VFKFTARSGSRVISAITYLFTGWIIAVALKPLLMTLPATTLWLLLAGGICYTLGVPFYLWRRLRYHHAYWHSFVLGGSTCHFLAVLFLLGRHTAE
jgi:hemolysin III